MLRMGDQPIWCLQLQQLELIFSIIKKKIPNWKVSKFFLLLKYIWKN